MTDAVRRLSETGLRPTPQRVLVYEYLLTHPTHPTADVIYRDVSEKLSTFSRTTVYNTLSALVSPPSAASGDGSGEGVGSGSISPSR